MSVNTLLYCRLSWQRIVDALVFHCSSQPGVNIVKVYRTVSTREATLLGHLFLVPSTHKHTRVCVVCFNHALVTMWTSRCVSVCVLCYVLIPPCCAVLCCAV